VPLTAHARPTAPRRGRRYQKPRYVNCFKFMVTKLLLKVVDFSADLQNHRMCGLIVAFIEWCSRADWL